MILMAKHLGQNVDEIFDVASRARNLESAMEMAAQLQLAGGSFANIDPMSLMASARKGPAELQKILAQMGSDIGKFNKETGEMDFGAVDIDRLNLVATATGLSVDSLQKQIAQTNKDAQKIAKIPAGMFNGLTDEERMFLLKSLDKNGNVTMSIDGLSDINKINKSNIDNAIKQQNMEKGTLEEQAQQNISFKDSVKNFKDSIMNSFVVFEPFIQGLTSFVQGMNKAFSYFGTAGKVIFGGLMVGLALLFSAGKQFASGLFFGRGAKAGMNEGGLMDFFKGKKGAAGGGIPTVKGANEIPNEGKPGGFLTSLSEGLKAFGDKSGQILKGALTLAASSIMIGGALILITAGIAKFGGDASGGQLVTFGTTLVLLASSMYLMSKIFDSMPMSGILEGSLAMVLIGVAMVPFSYAMQMFNTVEWGSLIKAGIAILGFAFLLDGLVPMAMPILIGAGILALASLSLMLFASAFGGIADDFNKLSAVNWGAVGMMGVSLLMLVPSLALLGGVGLFAFPSLMMMSLALGSLASVMIVLAPAMSLAAESTSKMAEGINALKTAVAGLDTSKLSELSSASERLSTGSFLSNISGALSNLTGGGKQENEVKVKLEPITIDLKISGRMLQQIILDDTKLIS